MYPSGFLSIQPSRDEEIFNEMFISPDVVRHYNYTHADPVIPFIRGDAGFKIGLSDRMYVAGLCIPNLVACLSDRLGMFIATLVPMGQKYGMTYYDLSGIPRWYSGDRFACRFLPADFAVHHTRSCFIKANVRECNCMVESGDVAFSQVLGLEWHALFADHPHVGVRGQIGSPQPRSRLRSSCFRSWSRSRRHLPTISVTSSSFTFQGR